MKTKQSGVYLSLFDRFGKTDNTYIGESIDIKKRHLSADKMLKGENAYLYEKKQGLDRKVIVLYETPSQYKTQKVIKRLNHSIEASLLAQAILLNIPNFNDTTSNEYFRAKRLIEKYKCISRLVQRAKGIDIRKYVTV